MGWLAAINFRGNEDEPTSSLSTSVEQVAMNVGVEKLHAARKVLVRIVQARADGQKFVPVILELERHIAAETDVKGVLARILNEAA